ncbi:PAS domain S-box-containing protein/diguanylate cyclase (GGDEF) domain-containing protein [Clostridium acidisoli DSM 12555]|uniref:PAS domain S-box-containing protein/diguanylate cyclase (GGDEF) domain-containing protein n=1 Tax=Clostridium acidisoli DSM 12555 TaxID=1121291 RepID=A0A1W1XDX6_9CLOT|nr:histidine kinase N-terminal 7TM domain-containing protein [Clostridium acidisoli]SMC22080.1 PAS domain S-box-containing protein/diguanylate cyclase (GGDEF) domain-containing protein [Clostridium acidisoli DSM 12555]
MKINDLISLMLLASVLELLYIGYFSWKKDKVYISIYILPVAIYALGYAFEILCTNIEWVKFWVKVEYLGASFLGVIWLMFVLSFTGHIEKIKKRILIALYIVPLTTLVMNFTNDFHHLFYKKMYMNNQGVFPILEVIHGPFYWVHTVYTYVLMVIGLVIFIKAYFKAVTIIRKQILFLIIAWIIPWISDVIYTFRLFQFHMDLCPLALSFSAIISSFAILKLKLLKLTPIAMEKVFSSISDGVIILDLDNNIVNLNNSSKNIISELKDIEPGDKKIHEVLKDYKTVLKALDSDTYNECLVNIKNGGSLRYYKMNINNVYEKSRKVIGKILMFHDITEIELQKKKVSDNLNFIETLIDAIPNPICYMDEHIVYNHCNVAFAEFLGKNKEEIIGKTVYEIYEKELAEINENENKKLIEKKGTQVYESKLKYHDNTYHDMIFSKSVVANEAGDANGLFCIAIDITEQKKDKEKINKLLKLKESMLKIGYSINGAANINNLLQLILDEVISCIDERSCGSILLLDDDKNLKIAVAKGYASEEVKKFEVMLDDHLTWFNNGKNINETVVCNDIDKNPNIKILDTKGREKIKSAISSPIIVDDQLYGFLNIDSSYNNIFNAGDIELMEYMRNQVSIAISKHKLYEQTVYLSRYDKLTNVYNRSYLEQSLNSVIYNDNAEKQEFFIAIFDLNGLKLVNDNYGHLVGDELIKTFSNGISSLKGASDIIGRFGGDEFVGVFFNVDLQSLVNKFDSLIEHFNNNPIIFEESKIICSYSYGIVKFPAEARELQKLLKIADERMYEYKRILKNKTNKAK